LLPLVTGQGRNGEWRKQEFVIEIESGQFPKKVCLSLWGDKIDQNVPLEGDMIKAYFDLESKEYNGRWFTDARAWRIEKNPGTASASSGSTPVQESYNTPPLETASPTDDLPF
jgi:hypothetical protein